MRTALAAVLVALAAGGCATPVSTNYFYVGGQYVGEGAARKLSGHMYVQVFEPAVKKHPFPVVLVHGNSQSGNNFIGTVDGRPGWAQDFSSRGYTVYVVDQVGRGRSGTFPSLYGAYGEPSISLVELLARAPDTTFPTARLNTQWPDKGVAGQPYFDQFLAQQMPSIRPDYPLPLHHRPAASVRAHPPAFELFSSHLHAARFRVAGRCRRP